MDLHENIPHKFDLTGLKAGDQFLGCKRCWWHSGGPVAMVEQCPNCGEGRRSPRLGIFTVTKEDVKT